MHVFDQFRAEWWYNNRKDCTISTLERAIGGLTQTSKMPWYSYDLPASECKRGSILGRMRGTVCSVCYAKKGHYLFSNTKKAQNRRLSYIRNNPERWAGYMAVLISRRAKGEPRHFRWHSSGDLQSPAHLKAILWIASKCPNVSFYLPTKEISLVSSYAQQIKQHSNITVRMSHHMIGETPTLGTRQLTATVGCSDYGYQCPAKQQGNICGDCRECWSKDQENINYRRT